LRAIYKEEFEFPGKQEVEKDSRDYQAFSLALRGRSNCSDVSGLHSHDGVRNDGTVGLDGSSLGSMKGGKSVLERGGSLSVGGLGSNTDLLRVSANLLGSSLGFLGNFVGGNSVVVDMSGFVLSSSGLLLGLLGGRVDLLGFVVTSMGALGNGLGFGPSGTGSFDSDLGSVSSSRPLNSHVSSVNPNLLGGILR